MLDRFFGSPLGAIALIFFILILAAIYLVNRERAHVQRMRGPRRFQPDWRRSKGPRRRRRSSRRSEFRPTWSDRKNRTAPPAGSSEGGTTGENREPEDRTG